MLCYHVHMCKVEPLNGYSILFTKASRTVIHSADITFQMLEDWRNVDLSSITKQTLYTMEDSREEHRKLIVQCE